MLNVFNFNQAQPVRVEMDEHGVPWFAAPDVCDILGYKNSRDAISKHCRQKGVAKRDTLSGGGEQKTTFINEGNLYRLIIRSRLPAAVKFEEWLMEEVLPSIRKTGGYTMPGHHADPRKVWGRKLIADAVIEFEGWPIRVVRDGGSVRFVAVDCCRALGYSHPAIALQKLDARFKRHDRLTDTMGRPRLMNTLAVEGAMALAERCRLQRACQFFSFMERDAITQAAIQEFHATA